MAIVGDLVIGRKGPRLPVSGNAAALFDFRTAMPAGSTYTRTGAATGLTTAGLITAFAADAPQRTDRGLALEPERTNLYPYYAPTVAQLGASTNSSNTTEPASPPVSGLNWLLVDNAAGYAEARLPLDPIGDALAVSMRVMVETPDGSQPVASNSLAAGDFCFMLKSAIMDTLTFSYLRLSGNVWLVTGVGTTPAGASASSGVIRNDVQNTRALKFAGFSVELAAFASSPQFTVGSALTRGLPVFTETVPDGFTKALLTYADATTTLVTGLTPGGSLDYVTPVLADNKGRFGASEMASRVWLS